MRLTPTLRRTAAAVAAITVAGAGAVTGEASAAGGGKARSLKTYDRVAYATTSNGQLVRFNASDASKLTGAKGITGLPAGVTLAGIDFRPATGDLYGVGSDSVVYRVNPKTAIVVAEAPAFTPALSGTSFGIDFNPVVDKIRAVSDSGQNLRLNVDEGTVLGVDGNLNPGSPKVVGAAYTNSSFNATKPTATTLYVVDAATDKLYTQMPPNAGTLVMGKSLGSDVYGAVGFDIAGAGNVGYLALQRPLGSRFYAVNVLTGATQSLGRVGGDGPRLTVTGLAVDQD